MFATGWDISRRGFLGKLVWYFPRAEVGNWIRFRQLFQPCRVRLVSGQARRAGRLTGMKKYMEPASSKSSLHEPIPETGLVAYFSMEIAIRPEMPTYSGGLGVLAGDTLRSAADLGTPLAAFSLLHRKGYFQQHLDLNGTQTEEVQPWNPADYCTEEAARVTGAVEGRTVIVRAWRYDLTGQFGHVVPIFLLDTDLEENSGWDRGLTDHLYGGDTNYRLQQEIVLGMGGARMANALGLRINVYHMNEGHAALLTLALLESQLAGGPEGAASDADVAAGRRKGGFT